MSHERSESNEKSYRSGWTLSDAEKMMREMYPAKFPDGRVQFYLGERLLDVTEPVCSLGIQPNQHITVKRASPGVGSPLNLPPVMVNRFSIFTRSHDASPMDPPINFRDLVEQLSQLGFPADKCELALKESFYDPDRAASLLFRKPQAGAYGADSESAPSSRSSLQTLMLQNLQLINDLIRATGKDRAQVVQVLGTLFDQSDCPQEDLEAKALSLLYK
jgi:hypothetical protein